MLRPQDPGYQDYVAASPSLRGNVVVPLKDAAGAYLAAEISTAAPRKLGQILYDRGLSLCRSAVEYMDAGEAQASGEALAKARQVLQHLLDWTAAVEGLAEEFQPLVSSVVERLLEAEFYRRRHAASQAAEILARSRARWQASLSARSRHASLGGWVG